MDKQKLINAIIEVESGGDDLAIGDMDQEFSAYGAAQIRWPAVLDVNNAYGTKYRARMCLGNRALSVEIFTKYTDLYANVKALGREPNEEDICRLWNGGPLSLYRRPHPNRKTELKLQDYWNKVKKFL